MDASAAKSQRTNAVVAIKKAFLVGFLHSIIYVFTSYGLRILVEDSHLLYHFYCYVRILVLPSSRAYFLFF